LPRLLLRRECRLLWRAAECRLDFLTLLVTLLESDEVVLVVVLVDVVVV
jgi:hypothetical protein